MSLFASGLASILQIKTGAGGFRATVDSGHQLQLRFAADHGRSGAENGGADVPTMMAALFGTLMVASCTEILLSRVLHLARRIITRWFPASW